MKNLILFAIILISAHCSAQTYLIKVVEQPKPIDLLLPATSVFIGGLADGINATLLFRYANFQEKHPNANPDFWNPDISWKRKYKDWDNGDKRARFPLSKGPLVGLTDGQHMTRGFARWGNLIGFSYRGASLGKGRKWYVYVINGAALYTINRIGFELSYNVIYK